MTTKLLPSIIFVVVLAEREHLKLVALFSVSGDKQVGLPSLIRSEHNSQHYFGIQ